MVRRRRVGATLGLVAACAFVIIVIGVGLVFCSRFLGGGRQVSNATDAGVLNVAKFALKKPGVPAPPEFAYCADPPGSEINLLNYNRCVAQSMLVAINAKNMGTPLATKNAQYTYQQLITLGTQLRTKMLDSQTAATYFNPVAGSNITNMMGGQNVAMDSYSAAYMKPGQSTNVYFTNDEVPPNSLPADAYSDGDIKAPGGYRYIAGYRPITINGLTFYGVPIFPQQKPHLVSYTDFISAKNSPSSEVPPNAFQTGSKSKEPQTGLAVGSVACAIVGITPDVTPGPTPPAGGGGTGTSPSAPSAPPPSAVPASIAGGYIEVANLPGLQMPAGWGTSVDANRSLFTNELFAGVQVSSSGCFSTNASEVLQWKMYNASTGSDPLGHLAALDPRTNGFPLGVTLRTGPGANQMATLTDALKIKDWTPCTNPLYEGNAATNPSPCAQLYTTMRSNYAPGYAPTVSGSAPPEGLTMVEYMKAAVMNAFTNDTEWSPSITPPSGSTGLKKFDHNKAYPAPPNTANFGSVGTIRELIEQASSDPDYQIAQITQRMKQIVPTASDNSIQAVFNTPVPMGQNGQPNLLFIGNVGNDIGVSATKPLSYSGLAPDGKDSIADATGQVLYSAEGTAVNTSASAGGKGDCDLYESPYLMCSPALLCMDKATWKPSSGAGNILGRIEFSQMINGGSKQFTFKFPN